MLTDRDAQSPQGGGPSLTQAIPGFPSLEGGLSCGHLVRLGAVGGDALADAVADAFPLGMENCFLLRTEAKQRESFTPLRSGCSTAIYWHIAATEAGTSHG